MVDNIGVIFIGAILVLFMLKRLSFGKKAYLYTLLMIPALIFNTNMLTEAVTVDEASYIPAFSNVSSIDPGGIIWAKASYQYRTTQMITGTALKLCRFIYPNISLVAANVLCKIVHWIFFFSLALCIAYIWGKYIICAEKHTVKYRLINLGVLYVLTGTPLACLLLKVCNYDAGNIYFAIAGLSLAIVAEKLKKPKVAGIGGIVAVFGCLEKWTSLIYWIACVAFYAFLVMRQEKKTKQALWHGIRAIFLLTVLSSAVCAANLFYLRVLYGKGIIDFSVGTVLFPLFFMARTFMGHGGVIVFDDMSFYDAGAWKYLLLTVLGILILTCMIYFFRSFLCKRIGKQKVISSMNGYIGIVFLTLSLAAPFALTRYIYPFVDFPQGVYIPKPVYNGTTYFYGAKTFIGHTIMDCIYAGGVVLANMPTVMLITLFMALVIMVKKYEEEYLLQLIFLMGTCILPVFTIAGQPAVPRYFGFTIMVYGLVSMYYMAKLDYGKWKPVVLKIMCGMAGALYVFELCMYLPLYACFSPIWLIRSNDFKDTIRQGRWAAGEAMTWGEEMAVAGNIIANNVADKNMNVSDVAVVTNYCTGWYKNPGFKILNEESVKENPDLVEDKEVYYVFVKFALYHDEIPDFIYEVEPVGIVTFNGEKTAWIYTANQLGL